ncbi:MAG: PorT family protein [Bacteroidales bacterium]|jgi:hypothetical protein|nr:PorT family protein [Bacteroidales bacterium]MCK9499975.1 PorT family protein [Bacteroidales bacterium]MDY0315494.1 outer membrane beta-barrel protein [Bacteroidales bacterium]NLB87325.1 PorT family protein [Bacteroidales bacterium]
MKRLSLLFSLVVFTLVLNAQGLHYGVVVGSTMSKIIEKSEIGQDYKKSTKFGYQIGLAAEYEILSFLYLGASLNYITKGDKYKDNFALSKINFGSFELPLQIGYKIPIGNLSVSAMVGPYTNVAVVGKRTFIPKEEVVPPFEWNFEESPHSQYLDDESDVFGEQWNSFKRFDSGICAGLKLGFKNYNLSANYSRGFVDIRPEETIKANHSVFNLSFIYYFNYY